MIHQQFQKTLNLNGKPLTLKSQQQQDNNDRRKSLPPILNRQQRSNSNTHRILNQSNQAIEKGQIGNNMTKLNHIQGDSQPGSTASSNESKHRKYSLVSNPKVLSKTQPMQQCSNNYYYKVNKSKSSYQPVLKSVKKKDQQSNTEKKRKEIINTKNVVWEAVRVAQEQQKSKINALKRKSMLEQFQEVFCQDMNPEFNTRGAIKNQFYDSVYGKKADKISINDQADLENLLVGSKCQVQCKLRSRMIDWMVEVFHNYRDSASEYTFFRAIEIMDHFLKVETQVHNRLVKNEDIHLIGVCCIFIASKVEDIWHITLQDVYSKIAHQKFTTQRIKEMEWRIISSIDFNLTSPTSFEFLRRYVHVLFKGSDHQSVQNIFETAQFILKMSLYDNKLRDFKSNAISLAVLYLSIQSYFETLREDNDQHVSVNKIQQGEAFTLQRVKDLFDNEVDPIVRQNAIERVSIIIDNFQDLFKGLTSLQRFNSS